MLEPAGVRRVGGVGIGEGQDVEQARELGIVPDRDDDVAVGRGERLVGDDVRVAGPVPLRLAARGDVVGEDVDHRRHADLDEAVAGTLLNKYRNSGQTCITANRILVQEAVYDEYLERLVAGVTGLKVGAGIEADVKVGPLIDEPALAKVERHVADAVESGAELHLGGDRHDLGRTFFEPTVLTGITPSMAISVKETFGPVAAIARFSTEEDAIAIANDTPYGLSAYFYSRDVGRIFRVSEALEYGMVGINVGILATEHVPFGGVKQSGLGREGSHHGMDDYVEIKFLCLGDVLK